MHLNGLGEANRLPPEALEARTQREMLAFELLRMALANLVLSWIQMALVSAPTIGEVAPNAKGLQPRFQLQKHFVLATPEDIGQHLAGAVIQRLPQPARRLLVAYVRPHFVKFGFIDFMNDHCRIGG